jgi:hypothetical protein
MVSPVFYYLEPDRYHFVARDFKEEVSEHRDSRVWFMYMPQENCMPEEMQNALQGYEQRDTVGAFGIRAILYTHGVSPSGVNDVEQELKCGER